MTLKILGAIFVFVGCGGFGFLIAATHRREVKTLHQLISSLSFMECEIQYHLTPLPELCRYTASASNGIVKNIFIALANEMDSQISPNVEKCMCSVISKTPNIPKLTKDALTVLGKSLGHFDADGQLKGLIAVRTECQNSLDAYTVNQDTRLRSYQTLGLCAGAAIAILFI